MLMKPADLSSLKQLLLWHHHNGRESQWMEEDERRGERGKKKSTTPPAAFLLSAVNNRLDQQTSDSSLSTVINRHQGQAIRDPFTLQVLQVVTCLTHVMQYDIVMLWQDTTWLYPFISVWRSSRNSNVNRWGAEGAVKKKALQFSAINNDFWA